MKKFELHWQILVALVIGVLFGIFFPPNYQITKETIRNIRKQNIPQNLISEMQEIKGEMYFSKSKFQNEIMEIISSYYREKVIQHVQFTQDKEGNWKISEAFFNTLREEADIPADLIRDLENIKTKTYKTKQKGLDDVKGLIKVKSNQFKAQIYRTANVVEYVGYKTWQLTDKSFEKIDRNNVPPEILAGLKNFNKTYDDIDDIEADLIERFGIDATKLYKDEIIPQVTKSNPVIYVSWMGDLFMRGLRMIIVPLILSSIISGVTNVGNAENLGRLGLKTILYYVLTSTFAIVTGLIIVNLISPGVNADLGLSQTIDDLEVTQHSFGDTLLNIVPTNVFRAFSEGDMLSIIFFAMVFGFFITRVNKKSSIFLTDFFNSAFDVMMKVTMFVIRFTPFGILGIVAKVVSENITKLSELMESMGLYMACVLIGLTIHAVIILPAILKFIAKADPWLHFKAMRSALLTAFSTSSSGATLSLTMESVENGSGVSNKITSFTLPLGSTINMDGTALYECVAAMFIAQAYGIDLTFLQQIIVVITSLLASVGAASIPMAGLVMISIVLSAIGLPLEGLGLILAVDRILDMFRTAINVWSDSCGAVTIAKSEGEELKV